MKTKTMLTGLFFGVAMLALSVRPAGAQTLSGGYALVNWNGCCANGFMVDFAQPVHKMGGSSLSAVGDFGWTRFSGEETDITYSGGARFGFLGDTKAPVYGQVTFGAVHWSEDAFQGFPAVSGTDFAMAFGGGTIIKINKTFGVKPQVDFFVLPAANPSDWFFRFTANAVINLGKK